MEGYALYAAAALFTGRRAGEIASLFSSLSGTPHGNEAGGSLSEEPAPLPASTEPTFGARLKTIEALSKVV